MGTERSGICNSSASNLATPSDPAGADIDPRRGRVLIVLLTLMILCILAVPVWRANQFAHGGAEAVYEPLLLLKSDLEHGRDVLAERHLAEARQSFDRWNRTAAARPA